MTSTPSVRRTALIMLLVCAAATALTLVGLRADLFSSGPGPIATAALERKANAADDDLRKMASALEEQTADADRPSGTLDHAGYQRYLDWFGTEQQPRLLRAAAEADGWSTADVAGGVATGIQPLIDDLRDVTPPADAVAAHERLLDSYVGYQRLLTRLSRDADLKQQPARDMTPLIKDTSEVREMWAAAAAMQAAGYDMGGAQAAAETSRDQAIADQQAELRKQLEELQATG